MNDTKEELIEIVASLTVSKELKDALISQIKEAGDGDLQQLREKVNLIKALDATAQVEELLLKAELEKEKRLDEDKQIILKFLKELKEEPTGLKIKDLMEKISNS